MKIDTEELHASLAKLEKIVEEVRLDKQTYLEEGIRNFAPDAIEARELLDALLAGLIDRYTKDQLCDVMHEMGQLREALEELDHEMTYDARQDAADYRYDEWAQAQLDEEQHG
jgi:hypothetical protein